MMIPLELVTANGLAIEDSESTRSKSIFPHVLMVEDS